MLKPPEFSKTKMVFLGDFHFWGKFGTKLYRQIVRTNCALLIVDLFLCCCERDFMMSLSEDKQAEVIDAFIRMAC